MSILRSVLAILSAIWILGCVTPAPTSAPSPEPAPADLETQSAPESQIIPPQPMPPSPATVSTQRLTSSVTAPAPLTPINLFQVDAPAEYNFSCGEFFDLLKKSQASTIDEALTAIQKVRPKYLSRTVYAYQSKNPYDASSEVFPRAIVYGGDAKMVLNFSGGRRHETYDRLEVMCFDDQKNQFEFHDVLFGKEAKGIDLKDLNEDEKSQKQIVITNGRDNRACVRCHQSPARPIWNTYALWPGIYGAIDDALRDSNRPDPRPIYSKVERLGWKAFQSIKERNKRYRPTSQELLRANSDFTLKLSYLNGRRIVGDLKRLGPAFEPHRYDFAKALFCAPKADSHYFGPMTGESETGETFNVLPQHSDMYTKDIFLDAYDDQMQKERRLSEILSTKGFPSPLPKEKVERLRLYYRDLFPDKDLNLDLRLSTVDASEVLLMRELQKITDKLGIEIDNWSMVPSGGFSHENGMGGDGKVALRLILERPFLNEFLKDDPELSAALEAREQKEQSYYAAGGTDHTAEMAKQIDSDNVKICSLIAKKTK